MRKDEREFLQELYYDCCGLEKDGQLTEFGKGLLYVCKRLLQMDRRARRK